MGVVWTPVDRAHAGKCWSTSPPCNNANKKPRGLSGEYQIAAGNAGWPFQFRFAVHVIWSRVPELWTLGSVSHDLVRYQNQYEAKQI